MRCLAGLSIVLAPAWLLAGDVSISQVHICCGSCIAAVDEALTDVEGVSDVGADQNTKTIRFVAKDDKAAEAGIKALARHGFFGKAKYGDKKLDFPPSGVKKGDKANTIVLNGVHLCCGACVTGAKNSLERVGGVNAIEIDRKEGKITLKGGGIDIQKAIDALNTGGFFATVKSEKEEKSDE